VQARDSANASRNWLQLAPPHYDGICLARWRRISVRGRFCILPEPGASPIYGRDSSHCLSHLASAVSNRILPEASSRDKLYAVSCLPDARI
jgi:hypothetical protein